LISFISVSKSKIYNAQPDNKIVKHILQSISITCIHTYWCKQFCNKTGKLKH
jgi:hypothetical protein